MNTNLPSKDENTAVAKVTARSEPTFVQIGKRQVISTGKWHPSKMADYLAIHGLDRWVSVGELAWTAFLSGSIENKEKVRVRLASLESELLERGKVMIRETGHPMVRRPIPDNERRAMSEESGKSLDDIPMTRETPDLSKKIRVQRVKIMDGSNPDERDLARSTFRRMLDSREVSVDKYKRAMSLVEAPPSPANDTADAA